MRPIAQNDAIRFSGFFFFFFAAMTLEGVLVSHAYFNKQELMRRCGQPVRTEWKYQQRFESGIRD